MVGERYRSARGVQPVGAAAALGMSAALIGGLILSAPNVQRVVGTILIADNIPLIAPTPEPTPEAQPPVRPRAEPQPRTADVARPIAPRIATDFSVVSLPSPGGTGTRPVETILQPLPTPMATPVLTGPSVDPRYARDLQPLYPAGEQRAGREGLVTLRVLVGADGRVRSVERVDAASDAFFHATARQALTKWRFRPATRDGVAVEAWRTMTVRFVLPD